MSFNKTVFCGGLTRVPEDAIVPQAVKKAHGKGSGARGWRSMPNVAGGRRRRSGAPAHPGAMLRNKIDMATGVRAP